MEGETLGILGNNGAGKSSLLLVLAGVIKPDAGEVIHNDGYPLLLSLQGGLDIRLSGYDNLIFCGMLSGCRKAAILENIDAICEFSGLGKAIYDPVITYSSGMRARLMFSLAIHLDRNVLLIDEMLGVGDAEFSQKSSDAIREKISAHRSVVLVSHNLPFLKEMCNRLLWIENQEIRALGDPQQLIDEYKQPHH